VGALRFSACDAHHGGDVRLRGRPPQFGAWSQLKQSGPVSGLADTADVGIPSGDECLNARRPA
jgi:hypothetical protein